MKLPLLPAFAVDQAVSATKVLKVLMFMTKAPKDSKIVLDRPDLTAFTGLALAAGGIVAGLVMEGGHICDVCQISAALIVLGGTIGALVLTTPSAVLASAIKRLRQVFFDESSTPEDAVEEVLAYAGQARRNGLVALEDSLAEIDDPFLRKALMLAIDGVPPKVIRQTMDLEMDREAADTDIDAGVFEAAGGYAPTLGIIGAVLGLIQVMKHLDNLSQVGSGIAVAFVATVYGVGAANLLLLPMAQKIRIRSHQSSRMRQLMLEGVIGICQGTNPRLLRYQLEAFLPRRKGAALDTVTFPQPATARAASA